MHILLQHHTRYEYERPVYLTTHILRLKPAAHCRTPIEFYSLMIKPQNHALHWLQDPFGNFLTRLDFEGTTQTLAINVNIIANLTAINPFDFFVDEKAQEFPFEYEEQMKANLAPYLEIKDQSQAIMKWLGKIDKRTTGIIGFLAMLNQKVSQEISYNIRLEPGVQTSNETLKLGSGSCRDSAWFLVQCLRHLGLAARFVSGYLIQLATQNNNLNKPALDTVDLHAWAEVYIPGAGWIGLDTTSGLFAGEGHIPLACTPSPDSAAPISGTREMSQTIFTYNNSITRL